MRFLSKDHENKLMDLINRDSAYPKYLERISLFYILSGNDDLYIKSRSIYDFENHQIEPNCLQQDSSIDLCSSSRALIKLAYNLFSSYQVNNTSPMDLLSILDTDNFWLAIESIKIRFDYSEQVQSTLNDDELEI